VPHLQRLAVYCGEAMGELERVVRAEGVGGASSNRELPRSGRDG
jgi:hypothetical protein